MSYRAPPPPDVGKAVATKTVAAVISYIPVVGPLLSSFAGPIVDVISGIGTDQRKLFQDWEASYLRAAGTFNKMTEPAYVTARKRNQARAYLMRILNALSARKRSS